MPTAPAFKPQFSPEIIADSIDRAERHARHASPALEAMALEMGRQFERFAGESLARAGIASLAVPTARARMTAAAIGVARDRR